MGVKGNGLTVSFGTVGYRVPARFLTVKFPQRWFSGLCLPHSVGDEVVVWVTHCFRIECWGHPTSRDGWDHVPNVQSTLEGMGEGEKEVGNFAWFPGKKFHPSQWSTLFICLAHEDRCSCSFPYSFFTFV